MKVGILGGGGCFGLNFARYLNDRGIDHFGIGRSKRREPAFWQIEHNYRYHSVHLNTQLPIALAILDQERPDVIVNYAAQGEGAASFGDNAPDFFATNCVMLTRLVCELRKRTYWQRFIQIGSSEVYGASPLSDESSLESDPLFPTSPYSASKAAFDWYLESMWKTASLPMNIIRPSNCYVEGQQLHRVIPKTIIKALRGEKLELHGGGKSEKSYLHANDLSAAVLTVIQSAPYGEIYNVGPDLPISIRDLVKEIAFALGKTFDDIAQDAPERVGQDSRYWLDCEKIKELGWQQRIFLPDGLLIMRAWIERHPELLDMPLTYRHRA